MLNKYKNGFIEVIQNNGLDYKMFEVEDNEKYLYLKFKNTSFGFITVMEVTSFHHFTYKYNKFKPKFPFSEPTPIVGSVEINEIYKQFDLWLKTEVQEYLNETVVPDLWKQVETEQDFVSGDITKEELNLFSNDEKTQIRLSVNEFKLLILKNFSPNKEELNVIENRLNYLSDSLDRLNKLDWRGLAISTTMSISMALSLDTEKGKSLFDLFKQIFVNTIKFIQQ